MFIIMSKSDIQNNKDAIISYVDRYKILNESLNINIKAYP